MLHFHCRGHFLIKNQLCKWTVIPTKGLLFFCFITFSTISTASAQCGLDIFIANDQSGSVDAQENTQSRSFITTLASSLELGNNSDQIRIAIADWDFNDQWIQYNFPGSGKNFTADLSDIIAYQNTNRVLHGGTDLSMALRKTYEMIINNPDRRGVPEMIILLTDACGARTDILELSAQIMAEGIFIALFGIDAAYNCPVFSEVASPGGHFEAYNYADLELFGVEYTNTLIGVACSNIKYVYDFAIKVNSFNANGCFPGPGTYEAAFTIENRGMEDFDDELLVSFYDEDPSLPSAKLIGVHSTGKIHLQKGEKYEGIYNSDELKYYETLYAIVNFDGRKPENTIPVYPQFLHPLLVFEGERTALNNISNGVVRNNGPGCIPTATIQVKVQTDGVSCNDLVAYHTTICNTGNADGIISNVVPVADEQFTMLHADISVDSTLTTHWATYYGGNIHDYIYAASFDKYGNIYLLGQTNSTTGIASLSAHQPYHQGLEDAFLVKMNSQGKRLWATYFGGTGTEDGFYVTTDNDGNVIITGQTQNSANLSTSGAHQTQNNGMIDAYIAKFDPAGNLLWATYYGGSGIDKGKAVYTDSENNIYLLGDTESADKISTPGSYQENLSGTSDAFLVKLDKNGNRIWGTYIGGTGLETGFGITIDKNNFIYITGLTGSTSGISTPGTGQVSKSTGNDGYVIKMDKNGNRIWGSYLGGNGNDSGTGVALDSDDNVYISGNSGSTTGIATTGSHQTALGGGTDAFLSKFTSNGQKVWTTYYGGSATDNGRFVSVDAQNNIYLTGYTLSSDNISTTEGIQPAPGGGADAFIAKFDKDGKRDRGTYFGGVGNDYGLSVLTDPLGKIYLAGATQSQSDLATEKTYQPTYGGGPNDGYLLKIDDDYSFILKAGECVDFKYYYNTKNALPGDYDFSLLIKAEKVNSSDGEPNILPDINFNLSDTTGVNGFSGIIQSIDNVTVTNTSVTCPAGDQVSVEVIFDNNVSCTISDAPVMAEIKINNTSGINIRQLNLQMNLNGSGAYFDSEPYQLSTGLSLARPNPFHPDYPNIPHALQTKQGTAELPVYAVPPGASSFKINIFPGTATANLQALLTGIPKIHNESEKSNTATAVQSITVLASPEILNWTCPASVTANQSISVSGITTSNTHQVFWNSSTAGVLNNSGTISQPSLNYTPTPLDIAKGYADISLQVQNNNGCTSQKFCRVLINNVALDYGDAPQSYDLGKNQEPVAGSASLSTEIFLGKTRPSSENIAKHSPQANGDGVEEDGLSIQCFSRPQVNTLYTIKVGANNTSTKKAYLNGFIDWNHSGDWTDTLKKAQNILSIPPNSGYQEYDLTFIVSSNVSLHADGYFMRLRISSDSAATRYPFGASPEGEVEDHYFKISEKDSIYQSKEICSGDSIQVGTNIYKATGIYKDILLNQFGCDSIIVTNLALKYSSTYNNNQSICQGGSYIINGHTYTTAGIYRDTLKNATSGGCDSIIMTNLTVTNQLETNLTKTICSGKSFTVGSQTFITSGNYQVLLSSSGGCDSLVKLNLTVANQIETNLTETICSGKSFIVDNQVFTTSGNYQVLLTSSGGCDSIVNLDLTVANQIETNLTETICSGKSFTIGNQTFTTSGNYQVLLTSSGGCDSLVKLNLTLANQIETNLTETICSGSSFIVGAQTFATTGNYTINLLSVSGCDSIVYLSLNVRDVLEIPLNKSICTGQVFTVGNQNFNATGQYDIQLASTVSGCDSLVKLDLTVLEADFSEEIRTICPSEVIYWNNQEIDSEGIYQESFTNEAGCDSTVQLLVIVSDTCQQEQEDCYLLFPNVFTPNGDGINDIFRPIYNCEVENYLLEIYNRWGILVFSSTDPKIGWNGYSKSESIQDNYIYHAAFTINNQLQAVKGYVLIIP